MALAALLIGATLVVFAIDWYGFSIDVHTRMWRDIFDRPGGPGAFRFYIQPTMAAIAALHDGVKDARLGRAGYLWSLITGAGDRSELLSEGLLSTARIVLLGFGMDAVYQYRVLHMFYLGEMVLVAILLALVPYVLLRGLFMRAARRWFEGTSQNSGT